MTAKLLQDDSMADDDLESIRILKQSREKKAKTKEIDEKIKKYVEAARLSAEKKDKMQDQTKDLKKPEKITKIPENSVSTAKSTEKVQDQPIKPIKSTAKKIPQSPTKKITSLTTLEKIQPVISPKKHQNPVSTSTINKSSPAPKKAKLDISKDSLNKSLNRSIPDNNSLPNSQSSFQEEQEKAARKKIRELVNSRVDTGQSLLKQIQDYLLEIHSCYTRIDSYLNPDRISKVKINNNAVITDPALQDFLNQQKTEIMKKSQQMLKISAEAYLKTRNEGEKALHRPDSNTQNQLIYKKLTATIDIKILSNNLQSKDPPVILQQMYQLCSVLWEASIVGLKDKNTNNADNYANVTSNSLIAISNSMNHLTEIKEMIIKIGQLW